MPLLDLLPVNKHKRANNNNSPNPINDTLRAALNDQLAHQRQRDSQAQADGHDERTRQHHRISPAYIAEETGDAIDEQDRPNAPRGGQLEGFDIRDGEDGEHGKEEHGVNETHEAEEEGHVKGFPFRGRGTGRTFQGDGVDSVDEGGEGGHGVAEGELGGGFVGEGLSETAVAFGVWVRLGRGGGHVDLRNQKDSDQTCNYTDEFAPRELLGSGNGANKERPDAGGG